MSESRLITQERMQPSNTGSMKQLIRTDSVPALILGTGPTALGVIRSLARKGIRSYCISHSSGLVRSSRWFHRLPVSEGLVHKEEELQSYLENLSIAKAVLIPCADNWISEVRNLPKELTDRFSTSIPPLETLRTMIDKSAFAQLLHKADIPRPKTVLLKDTGDLGKVPDLESGNWFLKPVDSQQFHHKYGVKAFMVESRTDAESRLFRILEDGFEVILQQYIPGPASNHYYVEGIVDREGVAKGWFARQRIRIYPPVFGNSSYMTTVPVHEVVQAKESLEVLFDNVKYRGLFSAEFKLDSVDGLFKIIELNARPWWYIEVPERCGLNLSHMVYLDALGEYVPDVASYHAGLSFQSPYFDISACVLEHREGRLSYPAWIRSWLDAKQVFFSWNDPLPTIDSMLSLMRDKARRIISGKNKREKPKTTTKDQRQ